MKPSAQMKGQPRVAEVYPLRSAVSMMSNSDDREPQGEYVDVGAKTSVYVGSDAGSNTVDTSTQGRVLVTIRYYGSAAPA